MTAHNRYISSVLRAFSTFCENEAVSVVEKKQLTEVLKDYLAEKKDFSVWNDLDNQQLTANDPASPAGRQQLIAKYLTTHPPYQTSVFLHEYLLALKADGCSPATVRNYRSDINQFLSFTNQTEVSKSLAKPKLVSFVRYQKQKGLKDSSIQRKLKVINQFGQWMKLEGILDHNPVESTEVTFYLENVIQDLIRDPKSDKQRGSKRDSSISVGMTHNTPKVYFTPEESRHADAQKRQERRARTKSRLNRLTDKIKDQTRKLAISYLNFALIILFFLGVAVFGYQQFFSNVEQKLAYPGSLTRASRVLSFQGRLTDTSQNPITSATNFTFTLHDDLTAGSELWNSGTCSITPDQDGIFSTGLGDDCGSEIDDSVFTENANIWLEVGVAGETLAPRQPIRTVAYAINSETLQGYPASASAVENTVLVMDNSGNVVLGNTNPMLQATGDSFTIEAQSMTLQTASGSDGDIILAPDGLGEIIAQSYVAAPGATLSATYAAGVPLTINGGPTGTGNLITLNNNSGTPLSVFDNAGYLGLGDSDPAAQLVVGDDTAAGTANGAGDAYVQNDLEVDGTTTFNNLTYTWPSGQTNTYILQTNGSGTLTWADPAVLAGASTLWTTTNEQLHPKNALWNDLMIGGTSTSSATFYAQAYSGDASMSGSLTIGQGGQIKSQYGPLNLAYKSGADAWTTGLSLDEQGDVAIAGDVTITGDDLFMTTNTANYFLMADGTNYNPTTPANARTGLGLVAGGAGDIWVEKAGDTMVGTLTFSGVTTDITTGTDEHLSLMPNGTGNVGIGTTSPGYLLDVAGTFSANSVNVNDAYTLPTADGTTNYIMQTNGSGTVSWVDPTTVSASTNYWQLNNQQISAKNALWHDLMIGGTSTASAKFYAQANTGDGYFAGNLGIGTTSPQEMIHVSGPSAELRIDNTSNSWSIKQSSASISTYYGLTTDADAFAQVGAYSNVFNFQANNRNLRLRSGTLTSIMELEHDTGNVGIGTTSPTAKLDIAGSASSSGTLAFRGTTDPKIDILNGENFGIRTSVGGDAGLTERLTVLNNGNVGVGTTNPGAKLSIKIPDTSTAPLLIESNDGTDILRLTQYPTTDRARLLVGTYNAVSSPNYSFVNDTNTGIAGGYIADTIQFVNGGNESLRIDSSGNVGIGTTSPEAKLDVAGNLQILNNGGSVQGDIQSQLGFRRVAGTADRARIAAIWEGTDRDQVGLGLFTANDTAGTTDPTEKMRISADGNVGIGTTSPSTLLQLGTAGTTAGTLSLAGSTSGLVTIDTAAAAGTWSFTLPTSGGTNNYVLQTDGSGNTSWADPATLTASTNYWTLTNEQIHPKNAEYHDLMIGGTATASATFFAQADTGNTYVGGNLGIGTTGPGAKLDLTFNDDNSPGLILRNTTSTAGTRDSTISLVNSDDTWTFGIDDNLNDTFAIAPSATFNTTTHSFVIGTNGQVGIGTTSPSTLLQLGTSGTTAGTLSLAGSTSGLVTIDTAAAAGTWSLTLPTGAGSNGQVLATDGSGNTSWTDALTASSVYWTLTNEQIHAKNAEYHDLMIGGTATASATFFAQADTGNTYVGGNMGIGTTNPLYKLHISGAASNTVYSAISTSSLASGNIMYYGVGSNAVSGYVNGLSLTANASTGFFSSLTNNGSASTANSELAIVTSASGGDPLTNYSINGTQDWSVGIDNSDSDKFQIVPADSLGSSVGFTIDTSNQVGIGTNSPSSLLSVGSSSQFQINSSGIIASIDGVAHTIDDNAGNLRLTSNSTSIELNDNVTFAGTTTLNSIEYTWPASQTADYVLQTDGSGNLSWVDANTAASSSNYWSLSNGAVYPKNSTIDLLIGGTASSSAKFAVLNIDSGTPTASVSAGTAGAAYLTADGTLATTALQDLTLGNSTTQDVIINPNGNVGIGTTSPASKLTVSGGSIYQSDSSGGVNAYTFIARRSGGSLDYPDLYGSSGGLVLADTSSHNTQIALNSNILLSGGNVGIGTTSPSTLLQLGTSGTTAGTLSLAGSTSGLVTIDTAAAAGTWTFTLPTSGGTNNYVLQTDGSGNTSWADPATLTASTNYWSMTGEQIHPKNALVHDLMIGGTSTASAKIALQANTGDIIAEGNIIADGSSFQINNSSQSFSSTTDHISSYASGTIDIAARGNINLYLDSNNNGSNTFKVQGNGSSTNLFTIEDTGNVGIGTTSPAQQLHLYTASGNNFMQIQSAGADSVVGINLNNDARQWQVQNRGSNSDIFVIRDNTAGSNRLAIDTSGQVGIGIDTPGYLLDVAGTFSANSINVNDAYTLPTADGTNTYVLQTNGSGTVSWVDPSSFGGGGSSYFTLTNQQLHPTNYANLDLMIGGTSTASAKFYAQANTGDASMSGSLTVGQGQQIKSQYGPLSLAYKSGANAWTTGLTVQDGTGYVGIGTTAPTSLLDVNNASGGTVFAGRGWNQGTKAVELKVGDSSTLNLSRYNSSSTGLRISGGNAASLGTGIQYNTADFVFRTGDLTTLGSEVMRFDTSGNIIVNETGAAYDFRIEGDTDTNLLFADASTDRVGIGTNTPATELDVAGNITLSSAGNTITTGNTELILTQTGDTFGTTSLKLQNRIGANGAVFENSGLDLVDFIFTPNSAVTQNIRYEHRAASVYTGNSGGQFEIGPADSENLFVGTGVSGFLNSDVGIGTTAPGYKLDVNGTFSANSVNVNDAYTFPTADGTNGYLLQTNGSGTVSWVSTASLGLVNYWGLTAEQLHPQNALWHDLMLGGTSTASANIVAQANTGYLRAQRFQDTANTDYFLDPAATGTSLAVAGSVGINTTAPGARFELVGSSDATQMIVKANSTQSSSNPLILLETSGGAEMARIHATDYGDIAIGESAGNSLASTTGGNTYIGQFAGSNSTLYFNTGIGHRALGSLTTGVDNTAVGTASLQNSQDGRRNVAIGRGAGYGTTNYSTNDNVFVGYQAGYTGPGENNVFVGKDAGYSNDNGTNNVFLGYQAGYSETGSNKLYIENSNSTIPLIYGDFSTDRVGIGTTSPSYDLHIYNSDDFTGSGANTFRSDTTIAATGWLASGTNANTINSTLNLSANEGRGYDVLEVSGTHGGSGSETGAVRGIYTRVDSQSTTSTAYVDTAIAIDAYAGGYAGRSSYVKNAIAGRFQTSINSGSTNTMDTAYGIQIQAPTDTSGSNVTITNTYGMYIASQTTANATQTNNPYAIYQAGASDYNYFAGSVGIGTTSPTSLLDVNNASGGTVFAGRGWNQGTKAVELKVGDSSTLNLSRYNSSSTGLRISGGNAASLGTGIQYNTADFVFRTGDLTTLGSEVMRFDTSGNIIVNETGAAYDFRIEGDTDTNLLFADASTDRIGIGTSAPGAKLEVVGSSDTTQMIIKANSTQSASNPLIKLQSSAGTELARIHSTGANLYFGYQSGNALSTGYNNTAMGYGALDAANTGYYNVAMGDNAAGGLTSGYYNLIMGSGAGQNMNGSYNVLLGPSAGSNASLGNHNILVGMNAGYSNTGTENVMLGSYSGYGATGDSNVFLGYRSGYNETGTDKLYIENSDSASPLIYGEFDTNLVEINGDLGVNDASLATLALNSATGTDEAAIGEIQFNGLDDASNEHTYAYMTGRIKSPTNGSENGRLDLYISYQSTPTFRYYFTNTGAAYADASWTTFSPYLSYNFVPTGMDKSDFEYGDVVIMQSNANKEINFSSATNESSLFGVVVPPEGFVSVPKEIKNELMNEDNDVDVSEYNVVPVAHLGTAITKVIIPAGTTINSSDPITSSDTPKFAQKATKSGIILGKSMQTFNPAELTCTPVSSVNDITWTEDDGINNNKECFTLPDGSHVGKVMVFVDVNHYDSGALANQYQTIVDDINTLETNDLIHSQDIANNTSLINDLKTQLSNIVTTLTVNTQQLIANLRVQTPEVQTDIISPLTGDDVTIQLTDTTGNSQLEIKNADNDIVTTINSTGDASFSGQVTAKSSRLESLITTDATVSGTADIESARIKQLEGKVAQLEQIKAQTAELITATVSGTLYADNIDGFQDKVANAIKEPSLLETLLADPEPASHAASVASLFQIVEDTGFTASGAGDLNLSLADLNLSDTDISISASAAFINNYFEVNGTGYISDSLGIQNNLFIGEKTVISDGVIEYNATSTSDIFSIQPSGKGTLALMKDLVILDENGLVTINGNVSIAGNLEVKDTLLTDLLAPTDYTNPLQVQVAGIATESGEVKKSRFEIINELGTPVATISAEGKADFAGGIGVDNQDLTASTDPEPTTDKTSGKAIVKATTNQITIKTNQISADSLVYVTPVGSTGNQVLYVKSQSVDDPATPENEGQFVVGFDNDTAADVTFNWWIVN